ncbi:hypothetical protein P4C99_20225 [Pontiellaceae bacterium B1224]|nr:hypothetical protein [Pontiellaceae bacterium B1224]
MKRVREWILIAGLLTGLSAVGAEEVNNQVAEHSSTTNMTGAAALWEGMLGAGMIDAAQFQHVQETGYLPGGSTVSNSPLSVLHLQTEWLDPDGSTNPIRFYKIEQIR